MMINLHALKNVNRIVGYAGLTCLLALCSMNPAFSSNALGDPATRGTVKGSKPSGLTPVEAEIKAGEVTVGSTSQVVVKFRNESGQDVKVGTVNLYPSSTVGSEISLNECSTGATGGIPAGAECAIVVSVKGLKAGNWRVEMLLRHDGKSKIVTAALLGTVTQGDEETELLLSDVEMIPNELDFGSLSSSRPLVKSVIMRNITSDPITISKVEVESSSLSGYSLRSECEKLSPGQACMVTVTWSPMTAGKSDAVLVVHHDGPTQVASVNIKGDYQPKSVEKAGLFPEAVPGEGLLVSSQEEIDFETITNEASITVSLVNVGDREMSIEDITLGSSDKGLTIADTGCKKQKLLQPVEACPLTINWSPVRAGEIIEDVKIAHDGARGILVLPVRGTSNMAVNKDSKAVVVTDSSGTAEEIIQPMEKRQALEGFIITSHSGKKAIINGPGGSRVVSQGQDIVLGGIDWKVNVVENGIDFVNGKDRVRLLFDRSLSSASRTSNMSQNNTSTSSTTSSTTSTPTTETPSAAN
jgi:hypothetical protein